MKNIYLDSCIWIRYINQTYFSETGKASGPSRKLIEFLKGDKRFQIILSPFLVSEISSKLRDWYIIQKVVKDGFSFRDFPIEKKNYKLTEKEREKIDGVIIDIGKIDNVNALPISESSLSSDDLEQILNIESMYYFDFYDAVHIRFALNKKCKYFVTTDGPLRKCAQNLRNDKKFALECTSPKGLLETLKRS